MAKDSYYNARNKNNLQSLSIVKKDLPSFCDDFFVGIQNRTTPLTRLNYAYDLRVFFDFYKKNLGKKGTTDIVLDDLDKLSAFDIERYLDYLNNYQFDGKQLQCGEHAKERKLSSLRSLIKYFFKKDLLTSDVASKVSSVKIKQHNITRLDIDEVARLLDMVEDSTQEASQHQKRYLLQTRLRDLAILTLFLGTGIRVSELVGLDNVDIDFDNNSFGIVRKGGNSAILHFSQEVADILMQYSASKKSDPKSANQKAFFVSMRGTRLSVRAVAVLVKKYSKAVSPLKKISPHKLRATYGTALYRETQDIFVVAEVLGHKDVNTTKKHYAQISEEIRRAAASKVVLRDKKP